MTAKWKIEGTIKENAEVRQTKAGKSFADLLVEFRDGQYERTLKVSAFDEAYDNCSGLAKGTEVIVEGPINSWRKEHNGTTYYTPMLNVSRVTVTNQPNQIVERPPETPRNNLDAIPF